MRADRPAATSPTPSRAPSTGCVTEPGHALVTGVGMHLAKHVAAVWSSATGCRPVRIPISSGLQAEVDAEQSREPLLTTWSGGGTVRAYTVAHGRDGAPAQGLVVLDTVDGRALARVHQPDLLAGRGVTGTGRHRSHGDHRWAPQRGALVVETG